MNRRFFFKIAQLLALPMMASGSLALANMKPARVSCYPSYISPAEPGILKPFFMNGEEAVWEFDVPSRSAEKNVVYENWFTTEGLRGGISVAVTLGRAESNLLPEFELAPLESLTINMSHTEAEKAGRVYSWSESKSGIQRGVDMRFVLAPGYTSRGLDRQGLDSVWLFCNWMK